MTDLPAAINNQYTEELINGMLLILKHQPDARHDLTTSCGTFIFGSADVDTGEEDETQLAIWKWEVHEDVITGKTYWAYVY